MKIKDMIQAVNLLHNEWDLGKIRSMAKGKICAWIYLMEILAVSEELITYKVNNKLLGFSGYTKWKSNKNKLKKKYYMFIKNILMLHPTIKNKKAIEEYLQNYDYTPKELQNYFDGEISILIVDKNYRGNGIGKKLLTETFIKAKNNKVKNLQILTDEACNFKFYEMMGCKKIYETTIINGEPYRCKNKKTTKAYIFEKVLN